jgi:hypothetical protein
MELMRLGLASRDLSSALYIHALKPDIRDHVKEHIATHDFFKDNEIAQQKPRTAIQALQRLATAREGTIRSKQHSQSTLPSQPKPKPAAANGTNQSNKPDLPQRNFTETYTSIPNDLYEARKLAGLCVRCNSNKHKAKMCTQPRNVTPVPAAAIRARLNALQAVTDEAPVRPPASNAEPKN